MEYAYILLLIKITMTRNIVKIGEIKKNIQDKNYRYK